MLRLLVTCAALATTALVVWAQPADQSDHRIVLPRSAELRPGAPGALSLTIAARAGYRISRDGPMLIELDAEPAGLTLAKRRYRRADAADAHAEDPRFDLGLKADAPGRWQVTVNLQFWVCAKRTCRPVTASRTVDVVAAAPAPPPADAGVSDASR